MKNKVNIFGISERLQNGSIRNSGYGQRFEFGLGFEQIFKDTVRKVKTYGLIAGQNKNLFRNTER